MFPDFYDCYPFKNLEPTSLEFRHPLWPHPFFSNSFPIDRGDFVGFNQGVNKKLESIRNCEIWGNQLEGK